MELIFDWFCILRRQCRTGLSKREGEGEIDQPCKSVSLTALILRYGKAGAVWDIWRVGEDSEALRDYCKGHAGEFEHRLLPVDESDIGDSVFDQKFYLGTRHRKAMALEYQVRAYRMPHTSAPNLHPPTLIQGQSLHVAAC